MKKEMETLTQTIRKYSQDIEREFDTEKCAMLLMKNEKRQIIIIIIISCSPLRTRKKTQKKRK